MWLIALAGCGGDGTGTTDGATGDGRFRDLRAAPLTGMPTVLEVTWSTDTPSTGHVVFGVDGAMDRVTPEQPSGTDHRVLLVGLPQDSEVTLRVEDGADASDDLVASTGTLAGEVPVVTTEGSGMTHFTALAVMEETVAHLVLLDPQGRVTWLHEDTRGLSVFRVRLAKDGSGIVYLSSIVGGGPSPDSMLVRVGWDGVETEEIPVPDLAHDFVELDDGTLVALAYETRDDVLGNSLISIPPGGAPTSIWSSWDCFDPVLHPSDDPAQGWTHANALDYDPVADAFLVGMRNLNGITEVDRATGACNWTLGGVAGDIAITGQERFAHQHQFERTPTGLLVFDNDGAPGQTSRVIEHALDPVAKTATVEQVLRADPPLFSFILGDVHRTEDGGTLIVWSAASTMDRLDASGTRTWRAQTPAGQLLSFAHWSADPYLPE